MKTKIIINKLRKTDYNIARILIEILVVIENSRTSSLEEDTQQFYDDLLSPSALGKYFLFRGMRFTP